MDYATDNQNPGIGFFEPNNPANPDPDRRWGWDLLKNNQLPPTIPFEFFGGSATYTTSDGAYLEFPRYGGSFGIRTVAGPAMGFITIQMLDYQSGAVLQTVQQELNAANYSIVEVPMTVANPQQMVIRVTVDLDPNEWFFFDGFRFLD